MPPLDLQVANHLSPEPQPILDQHGASSGVFLSSTPGVLNLDVKGKLVFGVKLGEWIQNTETEAGPDHGIGFFGRFVERMRLTNDGQLGINTTSPTAMLHVKAADNHHPLCLQGLATSTGEELVIDPITGNVFIEASSARFKENIRELKEDFRKLLNLRPVAFEYKDSGAPSVGYLAEDVAEQGLESLVMNDGEGKPFSVRYKMIPVYLVELVKQQQALIEKLQEQIAEVQQRFQQSDAQPAAG